MAQPEPTIEQVYHALESAIDFACDVDMQNEISAEYRQTLSNTKKRG